MTEVFSSSFFPSSHQSGRATGVRKVFWKGQEAEEFNSLILLQIKELLMETWKEGGNKIGWGTQNREGK